MGAGDACATENGDGLGVVEDFGRPRSDSSSGRTTERVGVIGRDRHPDASARCRKISPGMTTTATPVLLDGGPHRHLEDPRQHLRRADELAVDAAVPEQILRMRLLEVVRADLGARDVRGDREHRHPAALRVVETVDQMQVARAATACADRQLSGQRGIRRRRERGCLLVTDVLPRDFAGAPDRVGETIEAVTREAVDATHTAES